jgi:hypothetical protein
MVTGSPTLLFGKKIVTTIQEIRFEIPQSHDYISGLQFVLLLNEEKHQKWN